MLVMVAVYVSITNLPIFLGLKPVVGTPASHTNQLEIRSANHKETEVQIV